MFKTVGAPRYPEIRLAIWPYGKTYATLDAFQPDAIHVATEGPIGRAGRRYCLQRKLPFTTSYHTQFPHYLKAYFGIPKWGTYKFIRWFHGPAQATLAPTQTVVNELHAHGLPRAKTWSRGANTKLFRMQEKSRYARTAPARSFSTPGGLRWKKTSTAFLKLDLPGTKVVVGDGPVKAKLQKQYPDVHWAGYQFGEDLAAALRLGRRLRVSQPDRYLRRGDARSQRQRAARSPPTPSPGRSTWSATASPAASMKTCGKPVSMPSNSTGKPATITHWEIPGPAAQTSRSTPSANCRRPKSSGRMCDAGGKRLPWEASIAARTGACRVPSSEIIHRRCAGDERHLTVRDRSAPINRRIWVTIRLVVVVALALGYPGVEQNAVGWSLALIVLGIKLSLTLGRRQMEGRAAAFTQRNGHQISAGL